MGEARDGGKAARRECGVCWAVYDPAAGDPQWQVPPGTPFEDLPAHWSCPNCAAERSKFLELPDE
jgi:rubredoxin